jgi:NCAIR mutase (PurE)-related protein
VDGPGTTGAGNWREGLRALLSAVAAGECSPEAALGHLSDLPFADLGFARLDTLREARTGVPEVVLAAAKTTEEVVACAERLLSVHGRAFVTRVRPETAEVLCARQPGAVWNPRARTVRLGEVPPPSGGRVLVLTAGTSDLPVALEAAETAAFCGSRVARQDDVGVAGLHRILAVLPALREADAVVVVAGMEGALPGVVAGLTDRPVVGVPTSVGYGVSAGGFAALATMLAACAPGLAVVNVDNGFGAGVLAHRIGRRAAAGVMA